MHDHGGWDPPRPGVVGRFAVEGLPERAGLQDVDHAGAIPPAMNTPPDGLEGQRQVAGETSEQAREEVERLDGDRHALAARFEDVVRRRGREGLAAMLATATASLASPGPTGPSRRSRARGPARWGHKANPSLRPAPGSMCPCLRRQDGETVLDGNERPGSEARSGAEDEACSMASKARLADRREVAPRRASNMAAEAATGV